VEPKATFCHINHVNNNGANRNGGKEHTFKFLRIKDGVVFDRYRRNGLSRFVGVLIAK